MQALVAAVVQESERIKQETDMTTIEYQQYLESKFMHVHNVEVLLKLKQGQVEILQAPVLTDYSDAALIDRNVIEELNHHITQLGEGKVEALVDMKNYRKGIHVLEW